MPGDTILSANGATFTQNNCIVDSFTDLYANNIYYKTINGTTGATNYGYQAGGNDNQPTTPGAVTTYYNNIVRWPFALSITNSTNVGTLSSLLSSQGAASSSTYGYNFGGTIIPSPGTNSTNIQRWPFALAITNSTSVGNLTVAGNFVASSKSSTYGYRAIGLISPPAGTSTTVLERFPFSLAITNATAVGNITSYGQTYWNPGTQSVDSGYVLNRANQAPPGPFSALKQIDKYPFALAITNAAAAGTLARAAWWNCSCFSTDYGYSIGGQDAPGAYMSSFDRFPFALAITSGVNVGNLTETKVTTNASSSSTYGYTPGGQPSFFSVATTRIERFPFALAITNGTTVGNLASPTAAGGATEY